MVENVGCKTNFPRYQVPAVAIDTKSHQRWTGSKLSVNAVIVCTINSMRNATVTLYHGC